MFISVHSEANTGFTSLWTFVFCDFYKKVYSREINFSGFPLFCSGDV